MSDFLTANLEVLEARFPHAAELIRHAEEPWERRSGVNARGITIYQANKNGRWVNLTSAYDPKAEAVRQTEKLSLAEAKLVFAMGEGGLYHLESILERLKSDKNNESQLLFFSIHPDYLRLVLATRDVRSLLGDERFNLFLDRSWEKLKNMLQNVVRADIYDIPIFAWFIHPVEENLQADLSQDFQAFLHFTYETSILNHHTIGFFEEWWLHNFVCNIPYLMQALPNEALAESWSGRPVIVVGAGPSLNKNIDILAEAKGRALIFCVDTAYRLLAQKGIIPDLLVTLDGSPVNAEHMQGTDYKDVPLLLDVSSHRDILSHHACSTPKIIVSAFGYHVAWWERILGKKERHHSLETGGSVATAAVSFARHLGADPVILVGVDLSYPNGACYAQGTLNDARTLEDVRKGRQLYPVQDIEGNTVMTTSDYHYYLRWLHNTAELKDRRYINATEGGAVREGFIIKPLRQVLVEDCRVKQPVDAWKSNLVPRLIDPQEIERVEKNLHRSYREMKAALRLLNIMTAAGEKYLKEVDAGDYSQTDSYISYLNRAQLKLNDLSFAMSFLDAHSYKAIYTDIKMAEVMQQKKEQNTEEEKLKLSARQANNLVLNLRSVAQNSLPMHLDALENLKIVSKEMTGCEHSQSL